MDGSEEYQEGGSLQDEHAEIKRVREGKLLREGPPGKFSQLRVGRAREYARFNNMGSRLLDIEAGDKLKFGVPEVPEDPSEKPLVLMRTGEGKIETREDWQGAVEFAAKRLPREASVEEGDVYAVYDVDDAEGTYVLRHTGNRYRDEDVKETSLEEQINVEYGGEDFLDVETVGDARVKSRGLKTVRFGKNCERGRISTLLAKKAKCGPNSLVTIDRPEVGADPNLLHMYLIPRPRRERRQESKVGVGLSGVGQYILHLGRLWGVLRGVRDTDMVEFVTRVMLERIHIFEDAKYDLREMRKVSAWELRKRSCLWPPLEHGEEDRSQDLRDTSRDALKYLFEDATSWASLQSRLHQIGLSITKKGRGGAVTDGKRDMGISTVVRGWSFSKLEEKFSDSFEEASSFEETSESDWAGIRVELEADIVASYFTDTTTD